MLTKSKQFDDFELFEDIKFRVFYFGDNSVFFKSDIQKDDLDELQNEITNKMKAKFYAVSQVEYYHNFIWVKYENSSHDIVTVCLGKNSNSIEVQLSTIGDSNSNSLD